MSSPIFELSWDPRWNKMQKFMPHDPQNINPHDATFFAPYDMITNKRLQAIHGFSEIGPNAPQNCGAYPHQDSDVNALLDKLQLRQEKAPKSRFLHEVAKEKHSIPISSVDAASMWLSIFKAHLERYYRKKFPLNDAVNRFFYIFLRNWETLNYFNSSRLDKQFFDKFKTQHEKLSREEFHYLLRLIRHVDIAHLLEAPEVAEFVMILKQNRNQGLHSPSSSPESNDQSMLSTLLATTHTFRSQHISLEEVKQLYITIYFPNYQELWSSDVFILNASLEKAIAQFILKFPTLHKSVLEKMFGAIDRALRE